MICLALVGGLAYGGDVAIEQIRQHLRLDGRSTDPTPLQATVAGVALSVPGNMIRFDAAKRPGNLDRLDLVATWPDLEGFNERNADAFRVPSPTAPILYLTIRASDDSGDTSSRLDGVYTRFFSDDAWAGPNGLVGVRLDEKSGYAGEDLFFQPENEHPFVARCLTAETDGVPPTCLREITIEGRGLTLLYRFDKALLEDWDELDPALLKRVQGFLGK